MFLFLLLIYAVDVDFKNTTLQKSKA